MWARPTTKHSRQNWTSSINCCWFGCCANANTESFCVHCIRYLASGFFSTSASFHFVFHCFIGSSFLRLLFAFDVFDEWEWKKRKAKKLLFLVFHHIWLAQWRRHIVYWTIRIYTIGIDLELEWRFCYFVKTPQNLSLVNQFVIDMVLDKLSTNYLGIFFFFILLLLLSGTRILAINSFLFVVISHRFRSNQNRDQRFMKNVRFAASYVSATNGCEKKKKNYFFNVWSIASIHEPARCSIHLCVHNLKSVYFFRDKNHYAIVNESGELFRKL